jgi:hypothetical protein
LGVLLTGISVASLFLAFQLRDDVRYAMASATPTLLGEGRTADLGSGSVAPNQYVTVRATASTAGAVTYARVLWPGEQVVFPVAGRDGEPLYVQVPNDGTSLSRGEFTGRLVPFGAAGGRYAGVGRYLQGSLGAPVTGSTWLLVDGASPRGNLWAPVLASLLVALAVGDLGLLFRLFRGARR